MCVRSIERFALIIRKFRTSGYHVYKAVLVDTVLFNTHDVVLLLTVFQCLLLGVVLFLSGESGRQSNVYLLLFLLSIAVVPLDTLISFGAVFRIWAIEYLPNWFYVFEVGYWVQGPFLLWYLRTRFYKGHRFRLADVFYLVPFLLAAFHQLLAYHSLPTDVKVAIQRDYNLDAETFTIQFITLARELLRLYFGLLCVMEIRYYLRQVNRGVATAGKAALLWLKIGVYSFTGIWAWAVLLAIGLILNVHYGTQLPVDAMGLLANYGVCFLLSALLVLIGRAGASQLGSLPQILHRMIVAEEPLAETPDHAQKKEEFVTKADTQAPPVNPEYIERLDDLITRRRIFMDSSLSSESLARELGISPRTLSTVMNRYYGCNFFEFINKHRINEAKKLLLDEDYRNASMLDIMYKVGFNSKATFNNCFKKMEGITPREYKKANAKE